MPDNREIEAALDAFNKVREDIGGIKTTEDQRFAMLKALEAAERVRDEK